MSHSWEDGFERVSDLFAPPPPETAARRKELEADLEAFERMQAEKAKRASGLAPDVDPVAQRRAAYAGRRPACGFVGGGSELRRSPHA